MPAALTTFSSIIRLPMSLAPKSSASWPISRPCVTQLDWMLGKLSRYSRATACVFRYSNGPAGGMSAISVLSGWNDQQMKAVKPPVSSCSSRSRSRCSTRSASVSMWPNIIVAVLLPPSWCHSR